MAGNDKVEAIKPIQNSKDDTAGYRVSLGQSSDGYHVRLVSSGRSSMWSEPFATKEEAERFGTRQANSQAKGYWDTQRPKQDDAPQAAQTRRMRV